MSGKSPLFLDGWLAYNQRKWGLKPLPLHFEQNPANPPSLDLVLFTAADGAIVQPPCQPYMPVHFQPTPTRSAPRLHRQWLEMAEAMFGEMRRRGLRTPIALPPEIVDARLWQWGGFRLGVRYTFYIDFPLELGRLDGAIRQNIAKARRAGFRSERVEDAALLQPCLGETERRAGFRYRLSASDLRLAQSLLGPEHLRTYACFTPGGEVASAMAVLHRPGGRAILWLAGTRSEYLASGANQCLVGDVLQDLEAEGAAGCDYYGANLPTVALQKSKWGGRLVPFYTVEAPGVKGLARYMFESLRFATKGYTSCLKGF